MKFTNFKVRGIELTPVELYQLEFDKLYITYQDAIADEIQAYILQFKPTNVPPLKEMTEQILVEVLKDISDPNITTNFNMSIDEYMENFLTATIEGIFEELGNTTETEEKTNGK